MKSIIGVTGGIGTGKSEVGKILAESGGKVIDSDKIYYEVIKPGKPAYEELITAFGGHMAAENGEIDRKKLADIVFKDKEMLLKLNSVTHKHVLKRISELTEELKKRDDVRFIVLEVPVPVKQGFIDRVDTVWNVRSDRANRIDRVMSRSGYDRKKVSGIIDSQMTDEEYDSIADVTIDNNGSLEDLRLAVIKALSRLFFSKG